MKVNRMNEVNEMNESLQKNCLFHPKWQVNLILNSPAQAIQVSVLTLSLSLSLSLSLRSEGVEF